MKLSPRLRSQIFTKVSQYIRVIEIIENKYLIRGVRELYQSCMDRQTREERSLTDLAELLSRLGGWPVVEGDNWERGGEQNYWHWLSVRAAREGFDTESIIKIGPEK